MAETDTGERIAHVAEISRNARATWFGLIGALLFAGVTLLDVQDRDFFEYGAATRLPLVGVDVPVVGFFVTAPLLILALYAYLHIYLMKLWRGLAELPDSVEQRALDDVVFPWLLSDAAIAMKTGVRRDFRWLTGFVSWALGWAFAPVVIGFFWVRSWPYHHEGLTFWIGFLLLVAIWIWGHSRWRRRDWIEAQGAWPIFCWREFWRGLAMIGFGALALSVAVLSWETTEGNLDCPLVSVEERWSERSGFLERFRIAPRTVKQRVHCQLKHGGRTVMTVPFAREARWIEEFDRLRPYRTIHDILKASHRDIAALIGDRLNDSAPLLYPTQLDQAELVQQAPDWTGWDTAWTAYRRANRERVGEDLKSGDLEVARVPDYLRSEPPEEGAPETERVFTDAEILATTEREFERIRREAGAKLDKGEWANADLRRANLAKAFLVDLDLSGARMEGANLSEARMEGGEPQRSADGRGEPQRSADGRGEPQRSADGRDDPQRSADGRGEPLGGADGGGDPQRSADGRGEPLGGADGGGDPQRSADGRGEPLRYSLQIGEAGIGDN